MLALWLTHDSDSLDMTVVCIYALLAASAHKDFFSALHSVVRGNTILIGDFNSIVDSTDCLSNNRDATSADLGLLLEIFDFYEPPGSHHSTFTYHHPSIALRKSQIDRVYINFSSKWIGYATPAPYLDHYMVGLFVPKPVDMGPHQWQFPKDLLS